MRTPRSHAPGLWFYPLSVWYDPDEYDDAELDILANVLADDLALVLVE